MFNNPFPFSSPYPLCLRHYTFTYDTVLQSFLSYLALLPYLPSAIDIPTLHIHVPYYYLLHIHFFIFHCSVLHHGYVQYGPAYHHYYYAGSSISVDLFLGTNIRREDVYGTLHQVRTFICVENEATISDLIKNLTKTSRVRFTLISFFTELIITHVHIHISHFLKKFHVSC